jgi:hypothetical protein
MLKFFSVKYVDTKFCAIATKKQGCCSGRKLPYRYCSGAIEAQNDAVENREHTKWSRGGSKRSPGEQVDAVSDNFFMRILSVDLKSALDPNRCSIRSSYLNENKKSKIKL